MLDSPEIYGGGIAGLILAALAALWKRRSDLAKLWVRLAGAAVTEYQEARKDAEESSHERETAYIAHVLAAPVTMVAGAFGAGQ